MTQISTPIKIVVSVSAVLAAAMLVMYFMASNRSSNSDTTSAASLVVEKPLDFANAKIENPGPVFYMTDSKLEWYLSILLEEDDQVQTSAYTRSYTQSSLSEDQVYLRRNHTDTKDPSIVLDRYVKINICLDDECDIKRTKLENGEHSMVFTLVYEGFWYSGILTTHTHKEGVLLTSILSKGKPIPSSTESTVDSPVTTLAP